MESGNVDLISAALDESGIILDMDNCQRSELTNMDYISIYYISRALEDSGIVLELNTAKIKQNIAYSIDWSNDLIWLAYATRLDQSNIMFFLPDMYDALVKITGVDCGYYEAYTKSGDITIRIVGIFEGEQPLGPFWDGSMQLPSGGISHCALRLLKFGQEAQKELQSRTMEWNISCRDSENYLTIHRKCVRAVGRVLDVDMEDHDLSKTRIVQAALGYMWHWVGDKSQRDESLMALAVDAIKAGHLELENHHPEYDGVLDCDKMFTDRVAVHLQKDKPDAGNGWLLDPRFIPEQYRVQWECFKQKNRHLNMYKLVWDVINNKT